MKALTPLARPEVQAVRHFNRFYTRQIGVLREGLLDSLFSLTEVRVLYELAHREHPTATELVKELGLDAGYLSRILQAFVKQGLVERTRSSSDARQARLALTARGHKALSPLEKRSAVQVAKLLDRLSPSQQVRLTDAMRNIEQLLDPPRGETVPYVLRTHQPGDMGWVVQRHGELYWKEYGYDERFEALVAGIVAEFIQNFDPRHERCWIAERDGERLGCLFLVRKSKTVAKLRLLLVEPMARGLGIGKRLIDECVRFAREASYRKIVLWTQSELDAARHLYKLAGFRLAHQERHQSWSRSNLVAETWELKL